MDNAASIKEGENGVKHLKEALHTELLSHVDLSVIFFLLLRDEINIYNVRAAKSMLSIFNEKWTHIITKSYNSSDIAESAEKFKGVAKNVQWNRFIRKILHKARSKLGITKDLSCTVKRENETCSEEDYLYCKTCLGREPEGMICLIRRCLCKIKGISDSDLLSLKEATSTCKKRGISEISSQNPASFYSENLGYILPGKSQTEEKSEQLIVKVLENRIADIISEAKDYSQHNNVSCLALFDYDIQSCQNCTEERKHPPVIALISPFIVKQSITHDKTSRRSAKRNIRGVSNCENNMGFTQHRDLYTSHTFPLHLYLHDTGSNFDDQTNHPESKGLMDIADMIFNVVETLLAGTESHSIEIPQAAHRLIIILYNKLTQCQGVTTQFPPCNSADANNVDNSSEDKENTESSMEFNDEIATMLSKNYGTLLTKITRLVPFPTIYWLTDPDILAQVSSIEGIGAITLIQRQINNMVENYKPGGGTSEFLQQLIKDNLAYICSRLELLHPDIMIVFYNLMVNSPYFSRYYEGKGDPYSYIFLSHTKDEDSTSMSKKNQPELTKAMIIVNTARSYGIGGSRSFVHIKCLHTNLAFALAEGSTLGNFVVKLLSDHKL
ncbi:hypothetical protein BBOV_III005300 [Babesia bovis T2Bo]|uniref:Uncharacterized protein n=2 Tax=Babesia bovis TaxID=5865 RepID=A7ANF9_BABBO|nr:hypothetical protein BBOV_III005300 [Babesia bovis T2Bo]EDO08093.1 hypothetical protein BBOV_III005300 [Babesia bovis T2Bo]|eukprot:XP_001611661.1 hypothetical protein [Babesia bovis T2Bo]